MDNIIHVTKCVPCVAHYFRCPTHTTSCSTLRPTRAQQIPLIGNMNEQDSDLPHHCVLVTEGTHSSSPPVPHLLCGLRFICSATHGHAYTTTPASLHSTNSDKRTEFYHLQDLVLSGLFSAPDNSILLQHTLLLVPHDGRTVVVVGSSSLVGTTRPNR